eukprot:Clim_evm34s221 gene=Clim_evmTU34s221
MKKGFGRRQRGLAKSTFLDEDAASAKWDSLVGTPFDPETEIDDSPELAMGRKSKARTNVGENRTTEVNDRSSCAASIYDPTQKHTVADSATESRQTASTSQASSQGATQKKFVLSGSLVRPTVTKPVISEKKFVLDSRFRKPLKSIDNSSAKVCDAENNTKGNVGKEKKTDTAKGLSLKTQKKVRRPASDPVPYEAQDAGRSRRSAALNARNRIKEDVSHLADKDFDRMLRKLDSTKDRSKRQAMRDQLNSRISRLDRARLNTMFDQISSALPTTGAVSSLNTRTCYRRSSLLPLEIETGHLLDNGQPSLDTLKEEPSLAQPEVEDEEDEEDADTKAKNALSMIAESAKGGRRKGRAAHLIGRGQQNNARIFTESIQEQLQGTRAQRISGALELCGQDSALAFSDVFEQNALENCRKLSEGSYGEVYEIVFEGIKRVCKVIPVEGREKVNDYDQQALNEILPEIGTTQMLNRLEGATPNFVKCVHVALCRGRYPKELLRAWDDYADRKETDSERPDHLKESQFYALFILENGGTDLEHFELEHEGAAWAALLQTSVALAIAEKAYAFEHRDLHWGNVLVRATDEERLDYEFGSLALSIPSFGICVTIIDFTLSRIQNNDGELFYIDMGADETFFEGPEEEEQFEIYRRMRDIVGDDWTVHRPRTNIMWIQYLVNRILAKTKSSTGFSNTFAGDLVSFRERLNDYGTMVEVVGDDAFADLLTSKD